MARFARERSFLNTTAVDVQHPVVAFKLLEEHSVVKQQLLVTNLHGNWHETASFLQPQLGEQES
ncbi:hypothetical protein DIPPA_03830 [Diplonema papillatum]|nr:hypothetical protein DIPPA_03830 [Diplonema papillatum]